MEALEELKEVLKKLTGSFDQDLSILDKICLLKEYQKNDLFLKPGAIAKYSGYILKGAFREFYTDNSGREFNKAFCFQGGFTGSYYDLALGLPSTVTIQALTDSTVIAMPQKDFQELVKADTFWLRVAYTLAHNLLMKKFEKESQLLTLSAAERYDLLQKQHPELEQLVPAYHIASYLGITPISLSRIRRSRIKNGFLII